MRRLVVDADIGDVIRLDPGRELGNAHLENLGTDDANVGMLRRLPGQMLAAAKADFQPTLAHRLAKQSGKRAWWRPGEIGTQPRQETGVARLLRFTQRMTLSAAIKVPPLAVAQLTLARISLARSVRSHEKPPSASGARPK